MQSWHNRLRFVSLLSVLVLVPLIVAACNCGSCPIKAALSGGQKDAVAAAPAPAPAPAAEPAAAKPAAPAVWPPVRPMPVPTTRPTEGTDLVPVPANSEHIAGLDYKNPPGWKRQMDLYLPNPRPNRPMPVVLGIHGGGWSSGSLFYLRGNPDSVRLIADLNAAGIAVATVNYGTGEEGVLAEDMIANCKDAVRFLRKIAPKYGLDSELIGVTGGSAGGHLATMVAVTNDEQFKGDPELASYSSKVRFAMPLAGSMDLNIRRGGVVGVDPDRNQATAPAATRPAAREGRQRGNVFAGPYADQTENRKYYSPLTYLNKDSAALFIVHGSADPVVPVENAEAMVTKGKQVGANVRYLRVDGGGHTLFYEERGESYPSPREVEQMLVRYAKIQFQLEK